MSIINSGPAVENSAKIIEILFHFLTKSYVVGTHNKASKTNV